MTEGTAGTPTFLFTDIEGSTRLLQSLGDRYGPLLDQSRELIRSAVEAEGGRVFGTEGDAVFASFPTAAAGVAAAARSQSALEGYDWPSDGRIRVRMGVHTGEAIESRGDYVGLAVHQAARIMSAGHGGQVLVSEATRRLVPTLPAGVELRDLGEKRLKDLAAPERLHQLIIDGLDDRFPPLRTLDARTNNLPVQLTSFVGRAELAAARGAFAETRLLTLTGPGGTGKTRLALQLAAEMSDEFDDGVYFVQLDAITDVELVSPAIASALGLTVSGAVAPLDAVIDFLGGKRVLMLLDNFEQIVDAAPDVSRLLREAPNLKVIVTTRIVLHIYGEREFPVPPLGLPPVGAARMSADEAMRFEAVELFVERARAVQPAFALTDETAPLVVDICLRLDGLPLAIELAAARTRALPVAAIHARLDQHLSLLTGGSRDLPGRQQTLRGAIDWSYDLLDAPDRLLFERFSIHSGGAFLTQADAVCGPQTELGEDVLDGLTSLSDKSLVKPDLAMDTDPRFAMLVTIRDYAHERLTTSDDYEDLARRHAFAYLALVESVEDRLLGGQGRDISDRLELDHENLRAALEWGVSHGEVEFCLRFIASVWRFWQTRGHLAEARRRIDQVVAMPGVAEQPPELLARAYAAAGGVTYWEAAVRSTYRYYSLALEAARRSGNDSLIAEALYNLSFSPLDQDEIDNALYAAGKPYLDESLAIYERLGDQRGVADTYWGLAQSVGAVHKWDEAIDYAHRALAAYRQMDDPFRVGWGLYMLAGLHSRLGDWVDAATELRDSTEIFAAARDQSGILFNLAALAMAAQAAGHHERSIRIGGAVESLRGTTGAGLIDAPPDFIYFTIPKRPESDPEEQRWWDEGSRLSAEEAVQYALSGLDEVRASLEATGPVPPDKPELSGQ
ncbi:MAG TPA: AAA family ATPase [Candidatus Limnocylindrales bacterium]|jgi:predicted ATPase/class 3 adenylate cyclase